MRVENNQEIIQLEDKTAQLQAEGGEDDNQQAKIPPFLVSLPIFYNPESFRHSHTDL